MRGEIAEMKGQISALQNQIDETLMGYCLFCNKEEKVAKVTFVNGKASIEYPCGNVDTYLLQIGGNY
jgi:lysyl-tRNA synthetase class I